MNENQPNKLLNPSKTRKLLAAGALGVAGVAAAVGLAQTAGNGEATPTTSAPTTTEAQAPTTSFDVANNEIVFDDGVRIESNADGQGHLESPDYATTTTNPSDVSTTVPGETVDPNGVHLIPPATLDGNG